MKTYVVKPGDHLAKIALKEGLEVDDIWNDPANKELVDLRKNYNVLCTGDVVTIPDAQPRPLTLNAGQPNDFSVAVPTTPVKVKMARNGQAIANEAYEIHGLGTAVVTGTTDGSGGLTVPATPLTAEVQVRFPAKRLRYVVKVGHLDPASEPSGARQRLSAMGYLGPEPSGPTRELRKQIERGDSRDAALANALKAFQRTTGLPENGVLDQATADKLVSVYGN